MFRGKLYDLGASGIDLLYWLTCGGQSWTHTDGLARGYWKKCTSARKPPFRAIYLCPRQPGSVNLSPCKQRSYVVTPVYGT